MARVFCFVISLVFFIVPNFVSPVSSYASLMPGGSPTGLSGAHNSHTRVWIRKLANKNGV